MRERIDKLPPDTMVLFYLTGGQTIEGKLMSPATDGDDPWHVNLIAREPEGHKWDTVIHWSIPGHAIAAMGVVSKVPR